MAILNDLTSFSGSVGNFIGYKRHDSDKTFLRAKGGASKEKIKKSPKFIETRKQNLEWGGCSKAGKSVRVIMQDLLHITDYNISAPLNAIAKLIQTRDSNKVVGQRSVLFSENRSILDGFQLNKKTSLDSLIRVSLDYNLSRSLKTASLNIPELIPGINFFPASQFSLCRFIVILGMVPDVILQGKAYAPTTPVNELYFDKVYSNWFSCIDNIAPQEIKIALHESAELNNNLSLLLAFGIEYGNRISDEVVKQYKYLGSGKILKMV